MSYRNDAARVRGVNEPVWWINEIGVWQGTGGSGRTSSLVRLRCLRRTKLLGANKCETGRMGNVGDLCDDGCSGALLADAAG